jgi:AAHS family 4-hydroxybenzoate transporter-like MFS transporter
MTDRPVVPVSKFLDERGLTSFHFALMAWTVMLALIDGYDIAAIAVASPHLVREWHLANRAALGPVLSASLIGILFGSAIFGWIGDRYGRKVALISSNLLFGIFTWMAAYATNLDQMFWLRLIAGLGIGGVIPNVVAINAESAPRRLRATLALVTVGCVPLGGAFPGIVADMMPGWQPIFLIGGIVPVVVAIAAIFGLSESIKFMTLHESQRGRLERLVKTLRPDFVIPPNAKFVIEDERQFQGFNPAYLFRDGMAVITPLLWLLFALNLMGFYFLLSWTPTLLVAAKLPLSTAGLAISSLQVGGTVGALLLARWFERQQFLAISLVFLISVPAVAAIGFAGVSSVPVLMIVTFFAGFCVLGVQTGINVVGALVYPTSLRANGSGWELGIGRIGSIVGPLLGALFVGMPVQHLYAWSSLPFLAGAIVCFIIHRLNQARLRERPYLQQPVAAE